jgi:predicted nuclease of predicted toxin-antitoxin system
VAEPLWFWIDAQLPPRLAGWPARELGVQAEHVEAVGLREARDRRIFDAARSAAVVVITKDLDFVQLQERHGPPPRLVWITCGNVTNPELRRIIAAARPRVTELLASGELLVEISGPRRSSSTG